MKRSSKLPRSCSSRFPGRSGSLALVIIALSALQAAPLLAGTGASAATSQVSREATNDEVSPPNVLTGPDFRMLMKIMRTNIVRCGVPRTAVLRWHVLPDGVIDNFVLHRSSGDACFDEIVILNAEEVIKAHLRDSQRNRRDCVGPFLCSGKGLRL